MGNGLIPNPRKRNRSFFQQLAQPEEDEGFFGLGRYQPLSEFETPGQQPLIRAPRMRQPEPRAPAPTPSYPPPPEPPEMEPVSRGRRIGAALAAFAARFGGEPGAGTRVGQQIIQAPYQQKIAEYRRQYGDWKSQAEYGEAQEERGRARAGETRAQEQHEQYESPGDVQTRRAQEAEAQGLTGEAARRYVLTGRIAQPRDGRTERYTRTQPGGESELLERRPGEEYYRPAEMLAPGVRELAQPTTITGVGGQEMELPAPPPPTERVVSYPRPTRPSARETTGREAAMIERLVSDYLDEANGNPDEALALLREEIRRPDAPPELLRNAAKIEQRIRGRVRPGKPGRGGETPAERSRRIVYGEGTPR